MNTEEKYKQYAETIAVRVLNNMLEEELKEEMNTSIMYVDSQTFNSIVNCVSCGNRTSFTVTNEYEPKEVSTSSVQETVKVLVLHPNDDLDDYSNRPQTDITYVCHELTKVHTFDNVAYIKHFVEKVEN